MSGFAQTFTEHSSQHVSATVPSLSKPIIDHRAITILHGRKRPREVDGASTGGLEPFLILVSMSNVFLLSEELLICF